MARGGEKKSSYTVYRGRSWKLENKPQRLYELLRGMSMLRGKKARQAQERRTAWRGTLTSAGPFATLGNIKNDLDSSLNLTGKHLSLQT